MQAYNPYLPSWEYTPDGEPHVFGNRVYVDAEIAVDGQLKLAEAHEIAEAAHDAVEANFEEVKHIMIHENPA